MLINIDIKDLQDLIDFIELNQREVSFGGTVAASFFRLFDNASKEDFDKVVKNKWFKINLKKFLDYALKTGNKTLVDFILIELKNMGKIIDDRGNMILLAEKFSDSPIVFDYLVLYLNDPERIMSSSGKALYFNLLIELLRKSRDNQDIVKKLILKVDDPEIYMIDDGIPFEYEKRILRNLYGNVAITDTAMAMRPLDLPPHVVEHIINDAYNTRNSFGFYETMEKIDPIINPTPGVTRASRHSAFKDVGDPYGTEEEDDSEIVYHKISRTAPCPPGMIRNKRTGKCIAPCPSGMIKNKRTGKCIDINAISDIEDNSDYRSESE